MVVLLRSLGLRVVGVPVDEHGIIVEAIPPRARLVYVTPSHQYPLGPVMARPRRLDLLRWATHASARDHRGRLRQRAAADTLARSSRSSAWIAVAG